MRTVTFLAVFFWALGLQAVDTGKTAPDFSLMGSDGKTHRLSEYRGKPVVLEWFNDKCPFVEKHYKSGNMQGLQERFTGQGVVWLSVISSAEGNQGHVDRSGALKLIEKNKSRQTAILLDSEGTVGRAYSAKTTPHLYLVSPEGNLLYQGAIDNKPSVQQSDIEGATNHIAEALEASMAGKPIKVAETTPYGCSIKY